MQVHIIDKSSPVYFQSNLPVQNLLVWRNAELELWKVRFMFRNTVVFRGHLHFLRKNVNKEKVQAVFNLWRVKWVQCLHTISEVNALWLSVVIFQRHSPKLFWK